MYCRRKEIRDKFRFCQIFLGLETDEYYSKEEVQNKCNNVSLANAGNGLMKEIGNVVSNIEISDKKNIRFAGIGNIFSRIEQKQYYQVMRILYRIPSLQIKKGLMNKVTRTGSHNILQKLYLQL